MSLASTGKSLLDRIRSRTPTNREWRLTKRKPYEIQQITLDWLEGRSSAGILLDPGLGKTAVTLADFLDLRARGKVDNLVVTCPNSLKDNWEDEARGEGVTLPIYVWPKSQPPRGEKGWIFLTNYEALLSSGSIVIEAALASGRVMWTLDESVCIKNPQAKTSKIAISMSKEVAYKRILTGLMFPQGPQDAWAQLRFLGAIQGNFFGFRNRYCKMGGFKGKQIVGVRDENVAQFQKILTDNCLRATKSDWTDIPEKVFPPVHRYEMSKEQRIAYEQMQETFIAELEDGTSVEAPIVLTQLGKLQQIASGFIHDEQGKPIRICNKIPKLEALRARLKDIEGKAIVSCFHRFSLDVLMEELKEFGPVVLRSKMDQSSEELRAAKERFRTDPKCRIMVLQISSGKYGHTLLGDLSIDSEVCRTMFMYENLFSLDAREQVEDRIHRHGQRFNASYIDFVGTPVEQKVIFALQHKQNIVKAVEGDIRVRRGR